MVPPLDVDEALRFEERRVHPRVGCASRSSENRWGEEYFQAHLLLGLRPRLERVRLPPAAASGFPKSASTWSAIAKPRAPPARNSATSGCARTATPATLAHARLKSMPAVVRELVHAGWHIEAEGKVFRRPGDHAASTCRSGVDWFELHGEVDYGGADRQAARSCWRPCAAATPWSGWTTAPTACCPRNGWSASARWPGWARSEEDHIRFRRNQVGLLDALLAAQPEVRVDETFARVRERLRNFEGVQAAAQPAGFVGQLRDYQREGLGWMEFLREFGFGGCLADDMGVGKTAQVLALLETRGAADEATIGPSLVVVPKSLVFNWKQEAARFTPQSARARPHRPGRATRRFRRATTWS